MSESHVIDRYDPICGQKESDCEVLSLYNLAWDVNKEISQLIGNMVTYDSNW